MKNLPFFTALMMITLFAACTTQVETNLPESETTDATTIDYNEVAIRSTEAECDALENNLTPPNYNTADVAAYFECRLNQGVDEDRVEMECTFSEQVVDTACVDPEELEMDWQPFVDRQHDYVRLISDTCVGCIDATFVWGCRVPIFTVTYLNDTECPSAPDEWQFRVVADVYCCF